MPPSSAPRFSKNTLDFINRASRQKRPDWLEKNRTDYEKHLLNPLQYMAQRLKTKLSVLAPGYHFPQKGIGRLKRPSHRAKEYGELYKDWVSYSASRPAQSRFDHNPNLFFLIQPGDPDGDEVLVAGGLYMPSSRQLRSVREAIAEDASAFDRLFATKSFASRFPGGFSDERIATRPPRGFDPAHPRIDWLKLQAFFVWRSYTKREFASADFAEQITQDWTQILRLNVLLEQAIQGMLPKLVSKKAKPAFLSSRLDDIQAPRRKMDF